MVPTVNPRIRANGYKYSSYKLSVGKFILLFYKLFFFFIFIFFIFIIFLLFFKCLLHQKLNRYSKSEKSSKKVVRAWVFLFVIIFGIAVIYGFTAKIKKTFVLTVSQEWLNVWTWNFYCMILGLISIFERSLMTIGR